MSAVVPKRQGQAAAPWEVEPTTTSSGAKTELARLYRQHWQELVRYARRSFGSSEPDPEDVAQAAFEHYAALEQPTVIENPRAFLYRAARNFALDQRRRMQVRARSSNSTEIERFAAAAEECDAERISSAKERLRILNGAIRTLEPRQRDALILRRVHELSYVEIARRWGISQTHAKRLVAQAIVACERSLRSADGLTDDDVR